MFVEFKQAFDSIKRNEIGNAALRELGADKKLTNLIMMTLKKTTAKVAINGSLTEDSALTLELGRETHFRHYY